MERQRQRRARSLLRRFIRNRSSSPIRACALLMCKAGISISSANSATPSRWKLATSAARARASRASTTPTRGAISPSTLPPIRNTPRSTFFPAAPTPPITVCKQPPYGRFPRLLWLLHLHLFQVARRRLRRHQFQFRKCRLPARFRLIVAAEKGPSTFDTRHRWTTVVNYAVPDLQHVPHSLVRAGSSIPSSPCNPAGPSTSSLDAGGVNYQLSPAPGYRFRRQPAFSRTGHRRLAI